MKHLSDQTLFTFVERNANQQTSSATLTSALYSIIFSHNQNQSSISSNKQQQEKAEDEVIVNNQKHKGLEVESNINLALVSDLDSQKRVYPTTSSSDYHQTGSSYTPNIHDQTFVVEDSSNNRIQIAESSDYFNLNDTKPLKDESLVIELKSLKNLPSVYFRNIECPLEIESKISESSSESSNIKSRSLSQFLANDTTNHRRINHTPTYLSSSLTSSFEDHIAKYSNSKAHWKSIDIEQENLSSPLGNFLHRFPKLSSTFNHITEDQANSKFNKESSNKQVFTIDDINLDEYNWESDKSNKSTHLSSSTSSLVYENLLSSNNNHSEPTRENTNNTQNPNKEDWEEEEEEIRDWVIVENIIEEKQEEEKDISTSLLKNNLSILTSSPVNIKEYNQYIELYKDKLKEDALEFIEDIDLTHFQIMALDRKEIDLIKESWIPVRQDVIAHGIELFKE